MVARWLVRPAARSVASTAVIRPWCMWTSTRRKILSPVQSVAFLMTVGFVPGKSRSLTRRSANWGGGPATAAARRHCSWSEARPASELTRPRWSSNARIGSDPSFRLPVVCLKRLSSPVTTLQNHQMSTNPIKTAHALTPCRTNGCDRPVDDFLGCSALVAFFSGIGIPCSASGPSSISGPTCSSGMLAAGVRADRGPSAPPGANDRVVRLVRARRWVERRCSRQGGSSFFPARRGA